MLCWGALPGKEGFLRACREEQRAPPHSLCPEGVRVGFPLRLSPGQLLHPVVAACYQTDISVSPALISGGRAGEDLPASSSSMSCSTWAVPQCWPDLLLRTSRTMHTLGPRGPTPALGTIGLPLKPSLQNLKSSDRRRWNLDYPRTTLAFLKLFKSHSFRAPYQWCFV